MTDDPAFYVMDLDADPNIADLLGSVADTMRETPDDTGLYGIVSEEDGGIIAYAIGEAHANLIADALIASASA